MVIDVLTQRPAWARILLEAVGKGRINRQDISVAQARKIIGFNDQTTSDSLIKYWGRIGSPSESKLKFGAQVKAELADSKATVANFKLGRELYMKSCGQCHTLYGEGGRIGPDITGSQRQNLDYLLENIVEPSAAVSPDFRLSNIEMKDGRILSGLIRPRDQQSFTLITSNQTMILAKSDLEGQRGTDQSIMPEGQLEALNVSERTALLRYLMTDSPPEEGR
jgi:putative heme-binding domain-containing protein